MQDSLTRRAVDLNWRSLALGHEVLEADGATFVRNAAVPGIYDANFVFGVTASEHETMDRLLARARRVYPPAVRLTFRVGPFSPPAFEARLVLDGYEQTEALVLVLNGGLAGKITAWDIRPIKDETAWQAYAELKRLDCGEHARADEHADHSTLAQAFTVSNRLKCPPVQYALAYQDGRAVGHCSSWEGIDGVGQVEDLFVHPAYRHRRIATALIHYCVAIARARGAGPVVIVVDPKNTARTMYRGLGWRPVAVCRQYGKSGDAGGCESDTAD